MARCGDHRNIDSDENCPQAGQRPIAKAMPIIHFTYVLNAMSYNVCKGSDR